MTKKRSKKKTDTLEKYPVTPGPWRVSHYVEFPHIAIAEADDGRELCLVVSIGKDVGEQQALGNVFLMSQAKDLYLLCKRLDNARAVDVDYLMTELAEKIKFIDSQVEITEE